MNDQCFPGLNGELTVFDIEDGSPSGQIDNLHFIMPMHRKNGMYTGLMLHVVDMKRKFGLSVQLDLPVTVFEHLILLQIVILCL
ncbi:hypothetical protein D3C74_427290 [compost metagenome]